MLRLVQDENDNAMIQEVLLNHTVPGYDPHAQWIESVQN